MISLVFLFLPHGSIYLVSACGGSIPEKRGQAVPQSTGPAAQRNPGPGFNPCSWARVSREEELSILTQIHFVEPDIIKHNNIGCAAVIYLKVLLDGLEKIEKSPAVMGAFNNLILVQPARTKKRDHGIGLGTDSCMMGYTVLGPLLDPPMPRPE
ncbi:hypothetical protein DSO57_1028102 [Entomophthora muscae]|uniref:Uncharacterized protein n=1 Tax=Entomophthora muscae TaxID=34485 RepID=A0ACC2U041_9FUNG|nr:hypothetical protein DSO57_1028102 [Entomophthora muscae]